MILPVKKIVEEFYHDTLRFKNINQSIVIKYRKTILLQQLTVHIWIRSGFSYCFMLHQWQCIL